MLKRAIVGFSLLMIHAAHAQSGTPMTHEQLVQLTANGVTIRLGGEGMGYEGSLELLSDGTGRGSATTDAGNTITLTGTWEIEDGKFCRIWVEHNGGAEVCETWHLTSDRSVEVYNGSDMIGVNSW